MVAMSWLWSQADLDGAPPYPFPSFAVNLDESVTLPEPQLPDLL